MHCCSCLEPCRLCRHACAARFYWWHPVRGLRLAKLFFRKDNEKSLGLTVYHDDGSQKLTLAHRVLGFTFCCPPRLWTVGIIVCKTWVLAFLGSWLGERWRAGSAHTHTALLGREVRTLQGDYGARFGVVVGKRPCTWTTKTLATGTTHSRTFERGRVRAQVGTTRLAAAWAAHPSTSDRGLGSVSRKKNIPMYICIAIRC